jgi:nanoRNase/pAp phosphatase (c-di-AMP/oligoRNAs hydrolase)
MDGKCCAAIVLKNYSDAILFEMDYRNEFPFEKIQKDEMVFIVDYALKDEEFQRLMETTKNIVWIDHHKTSIGRFPTMTGVREVNEAACIYTWKYFYDEPVPICVRYIADNDTFSGKYGDKTVFFANGVTIFDTNPRASKWKNWLNLKYMPVDEVAIGQLVTQHRVRTNKELMKDWAFETKFEGFTCLAVNSHGNSRIFDSIDKAQYDILMTFMFDGCKYQISLYTTKDIDVSEIARKCGGGGHKQAAGFSCRKIFFDETIKIEAM